VLGRDPETGDFETVTWDWSGHTGVGNTNAEPVPGVIGFNAPLVFPNSEAFKDGVDNPPRQALAERIGVSWRAACRVAPSTSVPSA
jgi:hypothetical protein